MTIDNVFCKMVFVGTGQTRKHTIQFVVEKENDGKIDITIESINRINYLYFQDSAYGIPKAKRIKIFDNFMTNNKQKRKELDLPFCKNVMTSFGGDTKFILNFPLKEKNNGF